MTMRAIATATTVEQKIAAHAAAWSYGGMDASRLEGEICSTVQPGEVYRRKDGPCAVVLTTIRTAGAVGRDAFQIAYEIDGIDDLQTMPLVDFLGLPWVVSPPLAPR